MTGADLLASRGGILLIMNSIGRGGGDRVAMLLANGFARAGIPTRIALMKDAAEERPSLLDREVTIVSAGAPMGLRWPGKRPPLGHQHLERFRGVWFIRRQIDAFSPAIVLAASDNLGLVAALARRPQDARIAFAMKLTNRLFRPNTRPLRAWLRRGLFKFIFDRLDLVLTLAEADRIDALGHYHGRHRLFRTVANPYVTDEMLQAGRADYHGPVQLLAAGRMVRQKRFDVLVRAFALAAIPDARLTILGDGPLRAELGSLARSLGVAERVDMPGHGDVVAALRQSQLFVLSSDYEGLPAVLIEALACNVPVVTTDSFHAARELLGPAPSCAVVPIGNTEALAMAIEKRIAHSGDEDLRHFAEPYRVDAAVKAHIAALADALEAQNRTDTPA